MLSSLHVSDSQYYGKSGHMDIGFQFRDYIMGTSNVPVTRSMSFEFTIPIHGCSSMVNTWALKESVTVSQLCGLYIYHSADSSF